MKIVSKAVLATLPVLLLAACAGNEQRAAATAPAATRPATTATMGMPAQTVDTAQIADAQRRAEAAARDAQAAAQDARAQREAMERMMQRGMRKGGTTQ